MYYIKLKCFDCSGYFTGFIITSTGKEVGVHPYKSRAYKFADRESAFNQARKIKECFKCVISYEVCE